MITIAFIHNSISKAQSITGNWWSIISKQIKAKTAWSKRGSNKRYISGLQQPFDENNFPVHGTVLTTSLLTRIR